MTKKVAIIGGGIIGALEAYFAYQEAQKNGEEIRITIHEKNASVNETTSVNIAPSLTPDEILSVVPRGPVLVEKLGILFHQPGGIKVEDVDGVNDAEQALSFVKKVQEYSLDVAGHDDRTKTLLELGKRSMDLWQEIYDQADPELQQIFKDANFQSCHESQQEKRVLHDGYRIDLIYKVLNAAEKAESMKHDYESLGYHRCKILSPEETKKLDLYLSDFCDEHSEVNAEGRRVWKNDAVALYRPGGCLDVQVLLPKLYDYLARKMGTYQAEDGQVKNNFRVKYERKIVGVEYEKSMSKENSHQAIINGLLIEGRGEVKHNKRAYSHSDYVFCPGGYVGTMDKLGFEEADYAGFAGVSLKLRIPVSKEMAEQLANFNHCMEVHQEGVVLAWQARLIGREVQISVAGTKAFYGNQYPEITQQFATDRNLLQLNMINDVLPGFITLALGRSTKGKALIASDLQELVDKQIAVRWAGVRGVTFDGFPTLGSVWRSDGVKVTNARQTAHAGSGGVSFGPVLVFASRARNEAHPDPVIAKALCYGSAMR